MRPMPRSRRLLPYSLVLIGLGLLSTMQVLAKDHAVKCPKVMVHSVDRSKHLQTSLGKAPLAFECAQTDHLPQGNAAATFTRCSG